MFGLEKLMDPDSWRQRYARVNVYDARKELSYQAQRSGLSVLVRNVANFFAQLIENSAQAISGLVTGTVGSVLEFVVGPELARNLGLFAGSIGGSAAGIAGLGIAGGISAGFAEMDYFHQKRNLRDLYSNELAAKLGKAPGMVSVSDMENHAKENPVLDEELKRAKRQRNFAVPLAVVATLASFAVAVYALPALLAAASLPALAEMSWLGAVGLKTAVSMVTYMAVKTPLQAIGNKAFGLVDQTANDRIVDIQFAKSHGVHITPEHLMPVVLKSQPELQDMVVRQFGDQYDNLNIEGKTRAVRAVAARVPLDAMAQAINNGSMEPTELIYAAMGQASGVPLKPVVQDSTLVIAPEQQGKGFQERLGIEKKAPTTFTERVTQASASAETSVVIS